MKTVQSLKLLVSGVGLGFLATASAWMNHGVGGAVVLRRVQPGGGGALFPAAGLRLASTEVEEPKRNPDRPELPELKGDFDWDEKFRGDDDWITENVPGKVVLNELELAAQISALDKLESQWRKEREIREYAESQNVGFVEKAELINGRTAMFFLVTGLLTEYWTGFSMPAQVEEMLRVGGFIGFE